MGTLDFSDHVLICHRVCRIRIDCLRVSTIGPFGLSLHLKSLQGSKVRLELPCPFLDRNEDRVRKTVEVDIRSGVPRRIRTYTCDVGCVSTGKYRRREDEPRFPIRDE